MARGGSGGGGRGSGGGGGGRGFGGGGGRSFGGRSGGGSSNRGGSSRSGSSRSGGSSSGSSGSSRSGSSPYGLGGFFRLGPIYTPPRRRRSAGQGAGGGGNMGCLVAVLVLIVFMFIIIALSVPSGSPFSSDSVTKSTVQREPLSKGSVVETGYYTDEMDWIKNSTKLTTGMKNFYLKTGVQPYLYITDTINGSHSPTDAEVEVFANSVYNGLFADEAHFLLIFFEYGDNYHTWYLAGIQAKTVMDAEAVDILLDYVDRYYYDKSMTDEEFFSLVFDKAGERIMAVTTSPWIPVLMAAIVLLIIGIAFIWWKNAKKQKQLEAERTETILTTPLETFGDNGLNDLENKYKDPPE